MLIPCKPMIIMDGSFFIDSFLSLYFAYISNLHVILSCKVPVGLRLELLQNCFFFKRKNKLVNVSKLK